MEGRDDRATGACGENPGGDGQSIESLLGLVYDRLRTMAHAKMRRERRDHTLQPTALVHEAVLRILDDAEARFETPGDLVALAGRAMERVLIDHARRRAAAKRSARRDAVPLADLPDREAEDSQKLALDLDAIAAGLSLLEKLDGIHGRRKAEAVRSRYFLGLTVEQTSTALQVSRDTVERDLRFALAWLHDRMAS